MGDVSWRAARPSDAEALAALFQTIERTAPIGLETEPAEIVSRLSRPGLDLGRDSLMMVDHTGAAWAYAETADMGVGQGQFRIRLTSAIHPDADGEALRRTHDWLMHRATELHGARRPDLPGAVGARCAATDHSRLTLLTDLGFEVVGWHRNLVRPVDRPLPPAPTGIVVVAYDAGYDELVRLAHNDAYADSPAALLPDARSWPQHAVGRPNFLPDASFLALADTPEGPDIAAFLFSLGQRDDTGERAGVLHCLGTRKPWRRRGAATALIGHALESFRDSGFSQARLEVNSSNTDAVRLYTELGFRDSDRSYAMLQAPVRRRG